MLPWIEQLDARVFLWVNQGHTHAALDWSMSLISDFHAMKWLLFAVALGFLAFGGFRGRVFVLLAVISALVGNALVVDPMKVWTARERPRDQLAQVRDVSWYDLGPHVKMIRQPHHKGRARSMPSSHLAHNASIVMALMLVLGWRYWYAWLWPLAMAYSRLYTGDHFPTDVLAGWLLGCAYTLLICRIANIVWQRYGGRWAPDLHDQHPSLLKSGRAG
jgi:undecaprenyl-diphosphatase